MHIERCKKLKNCQLDVARVITNAVEVLKSDDNFGREETNHVLTEHFSRLPFKKQEKLTTRAEIGNQADVRLSLHNVNHHN